MYANYHTHTTRCGHATGTEREYIEKAVAEGLTELGFSDHVPYPFSVEYVSGMRMAVEQTEDYVETLKTLREEYRDRITIYIGYEAEYYPKEFAAMMANIKQYGYDYLILGQHHTFNEYDGTYMGKATENKADLVQYVNQTLEGLSTGEFLYLAHPDLCNYTGDRSFYEQEMTRLCVGAKQLSVPLEINVLGLKNARHYPSEDFWKIAARVGNDVVIGCDAHRPADLADPKSLKAAYAFAGKFGIRPVEKLEILSSFSTT